MRLGTLSVTREWIGGGDPAIARTVSVMQGLLADAASDYTIRRAAELIGQTCGSYDDGCVVRRVFDFVHQRVRYRLDPQSVELVKAPSRLLQEIHAAGVSAGDCDDSALLLAALLRSLGYDTRFVLISQRADGDLHHIYVQAVVGGHWLSLDPITPGGSWGPGLGGVPYASRRVYAE